MLLMDYIVVFSFTIAFIGGLMNANFSYNKRQDDFSAFMAALIGFTLIMGVLGVVISIFSDFIQ